MKIGRDDLVGFARAGAKIELTRLALEMETILQHFPDLNGDPVQLSVKQVRAAARPRPGNESVSADNAPVIAPAVKRRVMSDAAKRKISKAQRARWRQWHADREARR